MLHMGNCCLVIHLKHCGTAYSDHAYNKHTIYRDSSISIWQTHVCTFSGRIYEYDIQFFNRSWPVIRTYMSWVLSFSVTFSPEIHKHFVWKYNSLHTYIYVNAMNGGIVSDWSTVRVAVFIPWRTKNFFKLCWSNKD